MKCLDATKSYIYTRKFDCAKEFNVQTKQWTIVAPRYHFNGMEKAGNALLSPAEKWFTDWDKSSGQALRVALVVAAAFVAIAAVLGAGLKKIGEMCNPHSKIRAELLQNIQECRQLVASHTGKVQYRDHELVSSLQLDGLSDALHALTDGLKIDTGFRDKILKGIHGASEDDLGMLGQYGLFGLWGPHNPSPNFHQVEALNLRWIRNWDGLIKKLQGGGEALDQEKVALLELVREDPELHELVKKTIDKRETSAVFYRQALQLSTQYATISARWV